jgi:hypothetical protein
MHGRSAEQSGSMQSSPSAHGRIGSGATHPLASHPPAGQSGGAALAPQLSTYVVVVRSTHSAPLSHNGRVVAAPAADPLRPSASQTWRPFSSVEHRWQSTLPSAPVTQPDPA